MPPPQPLPEDEINLIRHPTVRGGVKINPVSKDRLHMEHNPLLERLKPMSASPASIPKPALSVPRWLTTVLIIAAVGLALGWVEIGIYLYYRFAGPIASGVSVGSTNVSGMNLSQAAAKIDQEWNLERKLLVSDGVQYWEARPLEFGLWVDPDATARAAYAYGRGEQRWSQIFAILTGQAAPEIEPVVVYSPEMAQEQIAQWAALVRRSPQPAAVSLQAGQLVAVPGADGAALDSAATLEQLTANAAVIAVTGYLPLITQPVKLSAEESAAQVAALQALLDRPLRIQAYNPITNQSTEWAVPDETLAGWIRVDASSGQTQVSLDESGFNAYLTELEKGLTDGSTFWISSQAYDLTGRWQRNEAYTVILKEPATTYTVQAGDTLLKISYRVEIPYWMISQANPDVDPDALPVGAVLTIPSKSDLLPEPVVLGKRIVISISQQHMTIYENGSAIRDFVISTGVDRSPTQPGVFQVRTHELDAYASVWDLNMPHFLGIYEAWPGFMNGIHGLPTLSNGTRLWASILGKPASYGCIILSLENAEWLYTWAETGVVVEIQA